jgi:hypothetical protein
MLRNIAITLKKKKQHTRRQTRHMDCIEVDKTFEAYIEVEENIEVGAYIEVEVQVPDKVRVHIELDQEREPELGKVGALEQGMVEEQVQVRTIEKNI